VTAKDRRDATRMQRWHTKRRIIRPTDKVFSAGVKLIDRWRPLPATIGQHATLRGLASAWPGQGPSTCIVSRCPWPGRDLASSKSQLQPSSARCCCCCNDSARRRYTPTEQEMTRSPVAPSVAQTVDCHRNAINKPLN